MDARPVGKLQRPRRHLDVFGLCPSQRRDARLANGLRNRRDGRKVALRGHGKAGLDDVHAQILKGVGHGELFLRGHAATRRLLAVAQGGVEENYMIWAHVCACLPGKTDLVQFFYFRLSVHYKAKL